MASKFVYSLVAVLGISSFSGLAWWYQHQTPAAGIPSKTGSLAALPDAKAARPVSVEVASVTPVRLADELQTVGNLRSRQGVMLRPEVSARVTRLNFRDGERVRQGQLLVQFDNQLQLAQLQQSQAELSIATANHKRNQELAGQNFISMRSVDESAANLEVAQAKLALAKANAARLQILAPFDGITGIRLVNVGDYLKDGADVVNIEDMDAVYVDFRLPERFQAKVKRGQKATVALDALPGRKFAALIQAIDPLIDANGRSVGVRGCIDNRQLQLRPGMFAKVNLVFGERSNALVVPEEAILPQGGRQFVIKVVDKNGALVSQRAEVKVGLRKPGQVEIIEGLQEGDTVVTAGQQRVQKDGTLLKAVELAGPSGRATGTSNSDDAGKSPAAAKAGPVDAVDANPDRPKSDRTKIAPAAADKLASQPVGPNPCLVGMQDLSGSIKKGAGRKRAGPEDNPLVPARNPS
jgi:membrane fusion protein (multidrug efflux system)